MAGDAASDAAPSSGRVGLALWALVFVLAAITTGRGATLGDAEQACAAAASLLSRGDFSIPEAIQRRDITVGPDGERYSKFPLAYVLGCLPAEPARAIGRSLDEPDAPELEHLLVGLGPAAVSATLALGFFLLLLHFGASRRAAALGAVGLIFTTPFWAFSRIYYAETMQAAAAVWCVLVLLRATEAPTRGRLLAVGALLGLLVHTKTTWFLLPFGAAAYFVGARRSWRRLGELALWAGLGAAPLLIAWLWFNDLRYGSPLSVGYGEGQDAAIGFGTPLWSGLYGLLFSTGKSVFLYAPLLLAAPFGVAQMARSARRELWLLVYVVGFTFYLTATWWAWHGEWSWGPRLVLPVIPLSLVPLVWVARAARGRAAIAALAVVGLGVNVLGVAIHHDDYLVAVGDAGRQGMRLGPGTMVRDDFVVPHFVPEMSPIVGHYWLLRASLSGAAPREDYPWKSLGIPGWRNLDETPPELNVWWRGSTRAWTVLLLALAAAGLLSAWLARASRPGRVA